MRSNPACGSNLALALGSRKKFQNVAVGITKIDAPAAFARIKLPILLAPGIAPPGDARFLDALEDRVELLVAHVKRVVVVFEGIGIVEVQGQRIVYPNRRKVAHRSVVFDTEDLREETRRRFFVMRRYNRVIQRYRHDCLPGTIAAHVYQNDSPLRFLYESNLSLNSSDKEGPEVEYSRVETSF